jgi:competence protein ComEC
LNNWSAVLHVNYNKNNFLFMADAELQSEEDLVASKTLSKVDVLKVGHHGSKDSSSLAFLKIVKPIY